VTDARQLFDVGFVLWNHQPFPWEVSAHQAKDSTFAMRSYIRADVGCDVHRAV
jgi:hypothetical protein